MDKTLAILAILGWGLFAWKVKNPTMKTQIETKEVIKFVDRVVNTETLRTITKPGGETVVERIIQKEAEKSSSKEASATQIKPSLPLYSVGVGVGADPFKLQPTYSAEVGARLGETPLWIKIQATSSREVFGMLSLEF
jgi:hypothetical protein